MLSSLFSSIYPIILCVKTYLHVVKMEGVKLPGLVEGGGFRKLAQNGVGVTQLYASPSQSRVIPYFSSKAWTYVGMNVNFKI